MLLDLVDSHAHLDFEAFGADLDAVLSRAWQGGVKHIVVIGSGQGRSGAEQAVALAATDERLYATVGVHPHDADLGLKVQGDPKAPVSEQQYKRWDRLRREVLDRFSMLALHPKAVAIGEVGLDFHYDHSPRDLQRALFSDFVQMALLRRLPLVIHARESETEVAQILQQHHAEKVGGVIHCFSGDRALMKAALDMGFYLGITGTITFPKAHELREVVRSIPLDRLLVETDAPYLAPVPHRGKRNEPAWVLEMVLALAALKGLDPEAVAQATTENARRLFGLTRLEQAPEGWILYPLKDGLYLNLTNRCTLACSFCFKLRRHGIHDIPLGLRREPSSEEVTVLLERELERNKYGEVVFCGIGEPLLRLEQVKDIGRWLRARGVKVRVNTDGLACLVHGRDVVQELVGLVDVVSVSLNAADPATYLRLCRPPFGEGSFAAVCDFIRRSSQLLPETIATAVALPGVDMEQVGALAASLGATFRARPYVAS